MSETTIQTGIQTAIQGMAEFADADVVINDWSLLDQSSLKAPYVIIEDADTFDSRQDTVTPNTKWNIPINLIERFTDWKASLDNLRTRRQAIINQMNAGFRNAGVTQVTIDRIYNDGNITQIYDRYIAPENVPNALPAFLVQRIILEAEEY